MASSKKTLSRLFLLAYLLTGGLFSHPWCHHQPDRARNTTVAGAEAAVRPIWKQPAAGIFTAFESHEDRSCHGLSWLTLTSSLTEGSRETATRLPLSFQGTPHLSAIAAASLVFSRTGAPFLSRPLPGPDPQLAHIRTIVLLI